MKGEKQLDSLAELFVEVIDKALESGFLLPLYIAAVAANGSTICARYREADDDSDGLACDVLAEAFVDDTFKVPVKIMVTDASERAGLVVISVHDATLSKRGQKPPHLRLVVFNPGSPPKSA